MKPTQALGLAGLVLLACKASVPAAGAPHPGAQAAATAEELPTPATLPRPRPLWSEDRVGFAGALASDGQDRVFAIDARAGALVAFAVASGQELWRSPLVEPPARPDQYPALQFAGGTVVYHDHKQLAAFAAADGRRRWSLPRPCHVDSVTAAHALFSCLDGAPAERFVVVEHESGQIITRFPGQTYDRGALGPDFAVIWANDGEGTLRRYSLTPGSAGAPVFTVKTGPRPVYGELRIADAAPGIILAVARSTRAFAADSGALLWEQAETGGQHRWHAPPILHADQVTLLLPSEVVTRALGSGQVRRRLALPAGVSRYVGQGKVLLRAHADTLVLAASRDGWPDTSMKSVLFHGRAGAALTAFDQPGPLEISVVLGQANAERLLSIGPTKRLQAFDLARAHTLPPLASLPTAEAAALMAAESTYQPALCERLRELPNAQPFWLEVLGNQAHALWACAVSLVNPGDPRAAETLRRLVQATDSPQRGPLLTALARSDAPATTELLQELARAPAPENQWPTATMLLHDHLWRAGRSTRAGLCPARGPRPDSALVPDANAPGVGTAHPLYFDAIARNGAWTKICQARQDTTGDGRIQITRSPPHFDASGDTARAYLVVGKGAGRPIDELLAADGVGRYLAVRDGPCLVVLDVVKGTAETMPDADLRGDYPSGAHPTINFDPRHARLAYLRAGRIVLRNLATAAEQVLDPGPGAVVGVAFVPAGKALDVVVQSPASAAARPLTVGGSACKVGDAGFYHRAFPELKGTSNRTLALPEAALPPQPPVPPGQRVELEKDRMHFEAGVRARRADGHTLGFATKPSAFTIPQGPLLWHGPR